METRLNNKSCIPCRGDVPPLAKEKIGVFLAQLAPGWQVVEGERLERVCAFPDFKTAWAYLNRIAGLAEVEWHHPDLYLAWGQVKIAIWTHAANGLTESDFILAAKIDLLPQ